MQALGILNFLPVDGRLATSGQPTKAQFEALAAEGYKAVINLAPHDPVWSGFDQVELLAGLGLDYIHIPVGWSNPNEGDLQSFCAAMDALGDQKILVHCVMNLRATAFVGLDALRRRDWSVEDAERFMAPLWNTRDEYAQGGVWKVFVDAQRARIASLH